MLDLKFDGEKQTPVVFYNQYRTLISNNLGKAGDIIKYKNNTVLDSDEKLTPMLEDLILLNVLKEIDGRLPQLVKSHYNHKLRPEERLMDVKSDILIQIPTFLELLNMGENKAFNTVNSAPKFQRQQKSPQQKSSGAKKSEIKKYF